MQKIIALSDVIAEIKAKRVNGIIKTHVQLDVADLHISEKSDVAVPDEEDDFS